MPRSANPVPSYSLHRPTGQAYVRLPDGKGGRRVVYLGKHGSTESQAEYRRILAELQTQTITAVPAPAAGRPCDLTVNEVLVGFLRWADTHYRNAALEPTTEVAEIRSSIRPVRELYGHTPAAEFGPLALKAVRQHMVGRDWCRSLVNRRIDRVKRVFKWATSKELVPPSVYQALRTLPGLQRGRTDARESEPVTPVDPAHVAATIPFLPVHLRCMVELQRLTGMRPGEACRLRLCEVDRTGGVWVYRPVQHKTAHRGKSRAVHIGPRAQAVLVAFLRGSNPPPSGWDHVRPNDPDQRDARLIMADAYHEAGRDRDAELLRDSGRAVVTVGGCVVDPALILFSPFVAREERFRQAREKRKSKVTPSQLNRRKAAPKLTPAAEYNPHTYAHAVRVAAEKAGVQHWHPNQLRHTFGTEVRSRFDLEAAQVALGHSRADVTQIYAEKNEKRAAEVAAMIG